MVGHVRYPDVGTHNQAPDVLGGYGNELSYVFRRYQAIKSGFTVRYRSSFDTVRDFLHDEAFASQDNVMAKYLKPDLLIIDDITLAGFEHSDPMDALTCFEPLSDKPMYFLTVSR